MHIGPTRLLEDSVATPDCDSEERFYGGTQGLDWDDNKKIEEAVADIKDNKNKAKDPQK